MSCTYTLYEIKCSWCKAKQEEVWFTDDEHDNTFNCDKKKCRKKNQVIMSFKVIKRDDKDL